MSLDETFRQARALRRIHEHIAGQQRQGARAAQRAAERRTEPQATNTPQAQGEATEAQRAATQEAAGRAAGDAMAPQDGEIVLEAQAAYVAAMAVPASVRDVILRAKQREATRHLEPRAPTQADEWAAEPEWTPDGAAEPGAAEPGEAA